MILQYLTMRQIQAEGDMQVGDLVKASNCDNPGHWCGCWFCSNNSNGIGVVIKRIRSGRDPLGTIAPGAAKSQGGYWSIMFDAGLHKLYGTEAKVINESRRHGTEEVNRCLA